MNVSRNSIPIKSTESFSDFEKKYDLLLPEMVKTFFVDNNGGTPKKNYVLFDDEEYEVRFFLSFNMDDNYSIYKSSDYFMKRTKRRLIPCAIDSGDNYYCFDKDTEKVYYYQASEDAFYAICDCISEFFKAFE